MKKRLIKLLCMIIILFTVSLSASAQIYVKVRPTFHVRERPPQPGPDYVWIDEEWRPNGRRYRYAGGHWERAPHHGYHREPGHWQTTRRGDMWVRGTWRRD